MSRKNDEDCEDFPEILLERRIALGFGKEDIAERFGITASAVGHWESGKHRPPAGTMRLLAKLLQMSEAELKGEVPLSPETRAVTKMDLPGLMEKLEVVIAAAQNALDEGRAGLGRKVGGSSDGPGKPGRRCALKPKKVKAKAKRAKRKKS